MGSKGGGVARPIAFSPWSWLERRFSLAAAVLFMAGAARVGATTFVVTKTADTNDGACNATNCSLRDAIIAANASPGADIITLPAGTYVLTIPGAPEDMAATGDLDILDDLTINGAGAATTIVDGGALDRVFQVFDGVTAVLNGITIRNGSGVLQGGGVWSTGNNLTLNGCVVTGNQSTGEGGGVYASTVTLTNTTISNNKTGSLGAGVWADNLTMTGSMVSGNQIPFGNGGGLYVVSDTTVSGSVITNNASGNRGGGIYITGGESLQTVSITDTTISNNTAIDDGGGLGGGLYIGGAAAVTVSRCTLGGNTSDDSGGGIANFDTLTLVNSTVNGNTTSGGGAGGGIFSNGNLTVISSTVASNSPDGIGNSPLGTATMAKTIVANNKTGCTGTITDGGSNLQFPGATCGSNIPSADPLLGTLANNGGPTQTQALLPGSPALNAAGNCPPPATDQRGVSRPQGSACEIGAFECQTGECGVVCPTITLSPATLSGANVGTTYSQTITASPAGSYTFALTAGALPAGLTLTTLGLLSGTPTASGTFTFTITATNSANCKGSQSYTLVVASSSCKAPPAPTLTANPAALEFGRKVTLSWNATIAPGQGTYVLRLSLGGSSFNDVTAITASDSTTVTYVFTRTGTPGLYDFQVLAEPACNPSLSSMSNHAQVSVSGPCPFAPAVTGLTVTPASAAPGEPFTLTWNPAPGFAGGYDVLVSTDGGQTFGLLATSATTTFSSTVVGTPGATLTFAVEPSGCIYTQPSNFASLTVVNVSTCQAPGAVSGILIRALGVEPARPPAPTEFIDVSWAPPAGGTPPAGYAVRLNGEPQMDVPSNSNIFPPRGRDIDPIQVFVEAQACSPAVSGPEVASDPVALFLTPPSASFSWSVHPTVGEPVLFTDTSVPQATSWLWVFDDGGTETIQSPSHTFTTAGPHPVSLVATNSAGSASVTTTITVGATTSSRAAPPPTPLRIDANDPTRRRVRVNIPGPDAVHLAIRSESAAETVVFVRFVDDKGRVLVERRLAVEAGREAIYDLGAYGPRGPLVLELVSGQMYQAQVWSVGHPGAREIER
jgi:CSLREA domain-containing protein